MAFQDEVEKLKKQILDPKSGIAKVPNEAFAKAIFGTDFTGINQESGTGAFLFDEIARERLRGGTSPVTTSAQANAGLDTIDDRISGLPELEQPTGTGEAGRVITEERERLAERLKAKEESIRAGFVERRAGQEQFARGLVSEARAGLAALGILGETPETPGATQTIQFLTDLKRENQRDLDRVNAEESEALRLARNAKDNKDFALAQQFIAQADLARQERNAIKQQEFLNANEARRIEKEEGRDALEQFIKGKQEERAEKQFNINRATDAFNVLINSDFQGLDELSSSEITKLEQTLGLVSGTIQTYAKNRAILREIEGWQFSEFVNRETGEVTITMFRPDVNNPGQIESRVTSLGNFGERFKKTGDKLSKTFKFDSDTKTALINTGVPESEITQLQKLIAENGFTDAIKSGLNANQISIIEKGLTGEQEEVLSDDTVNILISGAVDDEGNFDPNKIDKNIRNTVIERGIKLGIFDLDDEETKSFLDTFKEAPIKTIFNLFQ